LVGFQQTCIKVALAEGDVNSNENIITYLSLQRDLIVFHLLSVVKGTYSELLKEISGYYLINNLIFFL